MSIYISNSLYINGAISPDMNDNNPIIGWHSVLQPENIIASEYVSGRPAVNMWNPDTYSFWEGDSVAGDPSVSTTQYVTLVNTNNAPVDYIGIAKHNLGSVGYTYTLQHSTNGGSTWSNVTAPRVIATNNAIIDYFDQLTSDQFRIKLEKTLSGHPATIAGPIISHVKLGKALVLQRRIYVGHSPATIAKRVKKINNGSESGQYLGAIITRSYYMSECVQQNNTPAFVRTYIKPFIDHVNGHRSDDGTAPCTFFFAWRPGDYPDEIVYGWTDDNIAPKNQGSDSMGGRMEWSFNMECVA